MDAAESGGGQCRKGKETGFPPRHGHHLEEADLHGLPKRPLGRDRSGERYGQRRRSRRSKEVGAPETNTLVEKSRPKFKQRERLLVRAATTISLQNN